MAPSFLPLWFNHTCSELSRQTPSPIFFLSYYNSKTKQLNLFHLRHAVWIPKLHCLPLTGLALRWVLQRVPYRCHHYDGKIMDRIIQPKYQLFATDGWSHFYLSNGLNRGKFPCGISKYKTHGSTGYWVHTIYQNLSCWHNNPRQACNFSWRENNILLTQTYTCFWLLIQDKKYYCRLS